MIQKHDATRLHYDLRLEFDGVFKSWAVTRGPSLDPHDKRLAVEVEDHPLDYGDFEGTIPKGQYGGGTVQLWDRGYLGCRTIPSAGFKKGDLKFTLHGDKLHGSWVLVRMRHDRNGGKRTNWLLIKHRDEYAKEGEDNDDPRGGSLGRLGPDHGADRGGQGQGAKTVHGGEERQGQGRCGLALQPRRRRRGACEKPKPRKAGRQRAQAQPQSTSIPDFVAPQLCTLGRAAALGRRLGPRDQVRRLSRAAAGRGRQGDAEDPQGARLDRQVQGHREGGQRAAGRA